ncbi:MAG: tyrosine-protein phosphatase [Solobacterium sp.]|nr:tyrosine-protein phosphatase [Solobacterium sp.]
MQSFQTVISWKTFLFFNEYYVPAGEPLLVGYPGYPYIKVVFNSDDDLWETAGLDESVTASVTLNEKGKYMAVMEERSLEQLTDRDAFDSDEIFANFRSLKGGRLKEDFIYRGSSPIDNTYERAAYAEKLIEKAGIQLILNLSDSEESLKERIASAESSVDYYVRLYEDGRVLLPQLTISYSSPEMKKKTADLLRTMTTFKGPYFMHCALGKDRTGFVSLLLEMLAGAEYQEMLDDYMLSYDSFYHVTKISDPAKYDMIRNEYFDVLIRHIVKDETVDPVTADLVPYAEQYLREGGMSKADLDFLKAAIMQ